MKKANQHNHRIQKDWLRSLLVSAAVLTTAIQTQALDLKSYRDKDTILAIHKLVGKERPGAYLGLLIERKHKRIFNWLVTKPTFVDSFYFDKNPTRIVSNQYVGSTWTTDNDPDSFTAGEPELSDAGVSLIDDTGNVVLWKLTLKRGDKSEKLRPACLTWKWLDIVKGRFRSTTGKDEVETTADPITVGDITGVGTVTFTETSHLAGEFLVQSSSQGDPNYILKRINNVKDQPTHVSDQAEYKAYFIKAPYGLKKLVIANAHTNEVVLLARKVSW